MIKISRQNPLPNHTATKKKKNAETIDSGLFSGLLAAEESDDATPVSAAQAAAPMNPLNPLLGIQEISDEEHHEKQAVKHGTSTLDQLESLRDALLIGTIQEDTLYELERMVQEERSQTDNPELQAILDEIELRAAVEIAKLQVAMKGQ